MTSKEERVLHSYTFGCRCFLTFQCACAFVRQVLCWLGASSEQRVLIPHAALLLACHHRITAKHHMVKLDGPRSQRLILGVAKETLGVDSRSD